MKEFENNSGNLIEQAVQLFIDAQLQGQRPDIDEFVKQYPKLENQIRQKLQNLDKIENLFNCLMQADESEFRETTAEYNLIGQKLGDFEILELIGQGGMGAVFLARQVPLDREVALKIISSVGGKKAKNLDRFKRESKVLAKISHPNIVPIYEVGQHGPYSYFAMEYVKGTSLDKILSSIRNAGSDKKASEVLRKCLEAQDRIYDVSPSKDNGSKGTEIDTDYIVEISKTIISIATALDYAHNKGVLHRDIKPSNILIASDGTAKLVDFGLAKSQAQETITITGEFFGTPSYVSPEQIRKPETVDGRSDVFSLAATYYECLTLHTPFGGDTVNETLTQVISKEAVPPKKYCPRLSTDFNTVLLHALEKSSEDRYQTAGDFVTDIRNILEFKPIIAKKPSITRRVYKTIRRNPLKIAFFGVSILVIILGYYMLTGFIQTKNKTDTIKYQTAGLREYEAGRFIEAVTLFEKALELNPKNAEIHYYIGECYALDNNEKAIEAYQMAVKIDPKHAAAYWGLGLCYADMEQYQQSINNYKKAIEIDPHNADTHFGIADSYAALGHSSEASNAYSKAAMIYKLQGKYEDAIESFKAVIKNANTKKEKAKINIELGTLFTHLRRFEEAIEAYQYALENLDSDHFKYFLYKEMASILVIEMKRYNEAIPLLKGAININPQESILYTWLGNCYAGLGQYQEAIDAYSQSIKINPNDFQTLSFMAHCYNMIGDEKKAQDCLEKAIELTDGETKTEYIKRLEEYKAKEP